MHERAGRPRKIVRRGAVASLVGVAAVLGVAACGSKRPPPVGGGGGGLAGGGGGGGDVFTSDGGGGPPGCGELPDGGTCSCQDVPLLVDPPNIYFVLDHSGSMSEGTKWLDVRVAVGNVMKALVPRASFGAAIFPNLANGDECAAGKEIMSVRPGDSPPGTQGPTTTYLLQATNETPVGGTPTAATLLALTPALTALAGRSVVILATDGAPNCNAEAACDASGCTLNIEAVGACTIAGPSCCQPAGDVNCLDSAATLDAVTALEKAGVPTYVIGVPGSEPYANLLNQAAAAGGTASYYAATDSTSLSAALKKIAAKIAATCTYPLKVAVDPSLVNVYLDEQVVPQDAANGWTLAGSTVTLVGQSCQRVLDGDVLDVRIITGCPTVIK